jgi:hypothetical protein
MVAHGDEWNAYRLRLPDLLRSVKKLDGPGHAINKDIDVDHALQLQRFTKPIEFIFSSKEGPVGVADLLR